MASLAKPRGAGDTKKVRRMRKKLEGKATGGSISTAALLKQCRDVGVRVKPLLTPHLERHGYQPILSSKEVRQLVLHCASGSPSPRAVEVRNSPAVRAVVVIAATGTAVSTAAQPPTPGDDGNSTPPTSQNLTVPWLANNALQGFTEDFKGKFRLRAGLRISSGGGDSAGPAGTANVGGGSNGGWLKSLADALLYAPLGEDKEACPAGPFSGKKRKTSGGGGRKKKSKGDAKRRRREAEGQDAKGSEATTPGGTNGACGLQASDGAGDHQGEGMAVDDAENGLSPDAANGKDKVAEDADDGENGLSSDAVNGMDEVAEELTDGKVDTQAECDESEDEAGSEQDDGDLSDGEDGDGDHAEALPAVEAYLLTAEQLRGNGFPLSDAAKQDEAAVPTLNRVAGEITLPTAEEAEKIIKPLPQLIDLERHVQTQPFLDTGGVEGESGGARMFGLDCEMCVTAEGQELTRVTLVDAQHKVLLDQLVKPDNNITDYATRWSGITPELLENVDTKLHQVQAAILQAVSANDVLVGHSLENDLKALKMVHLRCLDTSLLYPHPKKSRRSSLRHLVSMYLQRTIQASAKGHNSAEDAVAALELAQLKLSRGPNFGAERSSDNVFDRLHRNRVPSTMVASTEQCRRHIAGAASAVPSFSDDGVVQTVLKELRGVGEDRHTGTRPPLVWAELEGPKPPTVQEVCAAAARGSTGVQTFLSGMDAAGRKAGHEQRITRILDGLPPGVVVFVVSQGVNPELPRKLDKQRKACADRRCASVWNAEQGELLEALENRARDGCVFVAVT